MAQRVAVNDCAPGSKRTSRVRVAVRLRPYMDKQDEKGEGPCVRGLGPQKLEIINWRNATETLQYHPSFPTSLMVRMPVYLLMDPLEQVLDLLSPGSQDLPIREDKDRNILIPGLTHTPLSSFADFDTHFIPASLNRTTASTKLNQRSSRSHAILLIKRGPPHRQQTGKLYLVDLAGSEDNRRTGNQGIRLKESGAINLSLFTLSKVVDALNAGAGGRIPYRDSKLTRLLQDSLGGSAHSVMITNIAPEYRYYFDTFSALNFAAKSKQIVNRPFVRETVLAPTIAPGKRAREEQEAGGSGEPQNKRSKEGKKAEPSLSPPVHPQSSPDSSVLDRLLALEKMMMGSAERERDLTCSKLNTGIVHTLSTFDSEQHFYLSFMLKEKQKELEDKANKFNKQNEATEKESKDALLFKTDLPPLHRKQSTAAKPRKQQAVVTPLQVSQVQPLQQSALVCKPSQILDKKKKRVQTEVGVGKENGGVDPPSADDVNWESHLDSALLEQSRKKILQTLNSGSLKDLKSLQLIGDKKAKLIMGWRGVHGDFTQLEDLKKIEGITAKRFSSFIKANILSSMGK
ncbi:Kinesin-like protein KIF22 [Labeo rohita]|uniref:Kinesin-like protein n=1 Tax=Labeo rohita TaxID=84645 RepID=A0ABQ8M928_LABRO|nr:Kinesin-like protein KIF22 [Labeo rohita]